MTSKRRHVINDQDVVPRGGKFFRLYKRNGHRAIVNRTGARAAGRRRGRPGGRQPRARRAARRPAAPALAVAVRAARERARARATHPPRARRGPDRAPDAV